MSETITTADVRQQREAVVQEHIDAENRWDVAATVATFGHSSAQMDVPAFGSEGQLCGHEAVRAMYTELFTAFPDLHIDSDSLRHGDDHVLVEAHMSGTQHADWAGIPNRGRHFTARLAGIFEFDGDQLQCERAYFDLADIARQLGG